MHPGNFLKNQNRKGRSPASILKLKAAASRNMELCPSLNTMEEHRHSRIGVHSTGISEVAFSPHINH
jgi:hypothetical protein